MQRRARTAAVTAVTALPLILAGGLAAAGPASAAGRTTVAGTSPTWAHGKALGHTNGAKAIDLRVYLAPRSGLAAFVESVSTPGSAQYGKYLTPAQYSARFAPTSSQKASVVSFLQGAHLHVTASSSHYVTVHGTVAAAEQAFGVTISDFSHDGAVVSAPTSDATVPGTLGTTVLTVTGLDSADHVVTPNSQKPFPPPAVFANAQPCSTYYGEKTTSNTTTTDGTPVPSAYDQKSLPYAPCGYTPAQLRGAYGVPAGATGKGQTVAITDAYAAGTIVSDADTYATTHGDPAFTAGQFTQVGSKSYTQQERCGSNGWYGEETLDVEAVHGLATGADVVYVGAQNCLDNSFIDAFGKIVDNKLATIVTNSWSDLETNETPAFVAAYEQMFQQGAAEGIGFYFSSGDSGDNTAGGGSRTVDYPASDPYVTAVGGTSLEVGANDDYLGEVGWGTRKSSLVDGAWSPAPPGKYLYGAGGGVSALFAQPDYQKGVTDQVSASMRSVPDVAAIADPTTGMLVGETQNYSAQTRGAKSDYRYGEYRIGGTSLASPVIAGIQAVTQEVSGIDIGFANPKIYAQAGRATVHDVVDPSTAAQYLADVRVDYANGVDAASGYVYSLRTSGMDGGLVATTGYDTVTGVGTPTSSWYSALGG